MVWGSIYEYLGVSKTFFTYNNFFWNELFNFASTTSPQSALGSLSKASKLYFEMLKNKYIKSLFMLSGFTIGGPAAPQTPLLSQRLRRPDPPLLNFSEHEPCRT